MDPNPKPTFSEPTITEEASLADVTLRTEPEPTPT